MKIGILGVGNIGKPIAVRLASAGHQVKVANSRGPETIPQDVLETGAQAVTAEEAMKDVDVVILSIPHTGFEKIRPLVANLPEETVVVDTSNYFAARDGANPEIEAGMAENDWVQKYFGRPINKAWSTVYMKTLEDQGRPKGDPDRIALPVAGDRAHDREVIVQLIGDTGFDGYDAGTETWRLEGGSPVSLTNLPYNEMAAALASADRPRFKKRLELARAAFAERSDDWSAETITRISRALFM